MDEVVEKFERLYPTLHVIGEPTKRRNGDLNIHCDVCGQNFTRKRYSISTNKTVGAGCPICAKKIIIKGVNDVATTHPWTLEYFEDKNDAYTNPSGTLNRANIKCPICGNVKNIRIQNLINFGFRCEFCSDKVSAPNKFSRAFLSQLPISNFKPEYSPEWISPKRYDNYFEYNGNKYILEMDGGFHYMDSTYNKNIKLEDVQEIDRYKDKCAKEHNIEIIRIDCRDLSLIKIQHKIEESKLSNIFDLSIVDWGKCQIEATKNLIKDTCELFKQGIMVKDIAKELNISKCTVRKYLKRGNEIGIVNYNTKMRNSDYKTIDVYKEDTNEFIGTYHYYNEIHKILSSLNQNEIYNECSIKQNFLKHKPYKGYIFIERENTK